jgi:hypothetical protein
MRRSDGREGGGNNLRRNHFYANYSRCICRNGGEKNGGRTPANTRTSSLARAIKNDQPTLNLWCTSRTVCKLPRQDRLAVGGGGLSYESAPSRFCRLFQMLLHAIRRRFITIRLHLFGTLAIAVLLLRRLVPNYPPKNPFCCCTPLSHKTKQKSAT